mgnify:FL=1
MAMALTVPRYTVADLERFPDDGQRYELLDGVLLVTPSPGADHQVVATRLASAILGGLGSVPDIPVTAPGVVIHEDGTQLEPDVLVYRKPGPIGRDWRGPRELWLAIEVLSPGSRIYDRDFKRDAYLTLGVQEVWLVDLQERAVYVSRRDSPRDQRAVGRLPYAAPRAAEPIELDLSLIFRDVE